MPIGRRPVSSSDTGTGWSLRSPKLLAARLVKPEAQAGSLLSWIRQVVASPCGLTVPLMSAVVVVTDAGTSIVTAAAAGVSVVKVVGLE
jgi:hypothetical protein